MKPKKPSTVEVLATRIAELEAANKKLEQAAPFVQADAVDNLDPRNAAAQARITARSNSNPDLVQVTRAGNVRTTFDPSDTFVSEQASADGAPTPDKDVS